MSHPIVRCCALLAALASAAALAAEPLKTGVVYRIEFEQAKQLARATVLEVGGDKKFSEWGDAAKTTFGYDGGNFMLGKWNWGVSVLPAVGLARDGGQVRGVVFEAMAWHGAGTMKGAFTEEQSAKLLAAVVARADASANPVPVTTAFPLSLQDLITAAPAVPAAAAVDDIPTRMAKLKKLHTDGLISDAEYEQKRKELLDKL